jgi:Zn-dependent peptidase ImmA (M78 family)/transcriptional regulator with XRE-family HTH domain
MPTAVIGANIRLARLFHGLSLEDVAIHLEKTRQYVHKIETEQIVPPDPVLEAIAELTQVYPVFFYRQISAAITEEQCHFRKHFTARAAVKHVALAKGEMFRRLVAGVEAQIELPAASIPQVDVRSLTDIEQAAESCRRHWGIGLGPVQNTIRLAENVGVVVTSFKGVSREVDAYSIGAARPIIVLNSDEASACRLRFDVAHELGHLVMHVGELTGDRKTESEANRFAGAFLLPRSSFAKEFPRMRGSHLNWPGLSEMKMRWRVSKAALLYRAKQLALITEDQYRTGVIRLNRGGEARLEREDPLIAKEVPELFPQAARVGFAHSSLSFDEYCRTLDVRGPILNEFVDAFSTALAPSPTPSSTEQASEGKVISLAERRRQAGEASSERKRG